MIFKNNLIFKNIISSMYKYDTENVIMIELFDNLKTNYKLFI